MARGQDAPIQTGGQIDPYVAASAGQGKQQSQNRLLAAMQEAGATSRAGQAERGATARAGMQIQAQQQMQAAELEANDRRAAEAEKARREDRSFQETQSEMSRQLEREIANNRLEWDKARHREEIDQMEEADKRADDMELIRLAMQLGAAEQSQNVTLKSIKAIGRAMEGTEKVKSYYMEQGRNTENLRNVYDATKRNVVDRIESDARISFSPGKQTTPAADLQATYQDALSAEGGNITIEDLKSPGMTKLKTKAMEGKLHPEDFRIMWAATDGMMEVLQDKIDAAPTDVEGRYWKHARSEIGNYKRLVKQFANDETSIETGTKRTFGLLVREGLGSLEGFSPGSLYTKFKEEGGSWDDFYKEMTSAREPYRMADIPDELFQTKYGRERLTGFRTLLESKRTKVGE